MNHWALRVARSTIFGVVADVLARAANTIFFILLTWFASEAAAGRYSLGFIYSMLLLPLAFAGFEQLLNREAARDPDRAPLLLGNLLIARTIGSLLCYTGLLVWLVLDQGYDRQTAIVIAILAATIVPESLINLYQGYLFAFERVAYITLIGAITGAFKLATGLIVLALGGGAMGAAGAVLATSIISFILYTAIVARRIAPPQWKPDWHIWTRSFLPAGSFFIIAILLTLENALGPLLLSRYYGPVAVGVYSAASNLINILNMLPTSFRQAILPLMTSAYVQAQEQAIRILSQSLRMLLTITLFLGVNASLIAAPLLGIVYQGKFADAAPVFIALIWAFTFTTCAIPHGRMIVVTNHQGMFIPFHFVSMVLNLVLSLLLMRTMAVLGVALATMASSFFIFLAGLVYVQLRIQRWPVARVIRGPVVAAILMMAGVWVLHMMHVPLLLAMLPGWLIYGGALWGLRVFSLDDIRLIQQFIRRRRAVLDST
jgi:O-antigen/teichoic acid export membrane protein